MSQLAFSVEIPESEPVVESSEMIFLDDASYEFVGGGDTHTGF